MSVSQEEISNKIKHFQTLPRGMAISVECQFIHMAQGGDGSEAQEGEIRQTYYPTWTTEDFQKVCRSMGWDYKTKDKKPFS